MIYEIAELYIKPDAHDAFQAGVAEAVPLFKAATGCLSMRLDRDIETPDTYHLVIGWQTLENHTVCLLYTSPSPRDRQKSRMPSSA